MRRVVLGEGALASALGRASAREGSVLRGSREPDGGPWWWRRVDPATGAGVASLLRGADEVLVDLEGWADAAGVASLARQAEGARCVVLLPADAEVPPWVPHVGWAVLHLGPVLHGGLAPIARIREGARGGTVWVPAVAQLRPVSLGDVLGAARAIPAGARWVLAAEAPVALPEVVRALAPDATVRTGPAAVVAAAAGDDASLWRAWSARSGRGASLPGAAWSPDPPAAWFLDPGEARPSRVVADRLPA